jgi:hypothetical protein
MHKFTVTISQEFEADTREEAALLMFQQLANDLPPLQYLVANETKTAVFVDLNREKAEEFAAMDHTADPGNW